MSFSSDKYSDELCAQRKCDGDPCQSRALRGERFCHYHKVMGKPAINIDNDPTGHAYLPVFEDAVSIQSAISDVCEMMLHRRIEPKEAQRRPLFFRRTVVKGSFDRSRQPRYLVIWA